MTMRLSHSSLTGTERTLVAVGTVRLASMLATVRAGAPLRTVSFGSALAAFSCSSSLPSFSSLALPSLLLDELLLADFFAPACFLSDDLVAGLSSLLVL